MALDAVDLEGRARRRRRRSASSSAFGGDLLERQRGDLRRDCRPAPPWPRRSRPRRRRGSNSRAGRGVAAVDQRQGRIEHDVDEREDDRGVEGPQPPARQRRVQLLDAVPLVAGGRLAGDRIDLDACGLCVRSWSCRLQPWLSPRRSSCLKGMSACVAVDRGARPERPDERRRRRRASRTTSAPAVGEVAQRRRSSMASPPVLFGSGS